MRLCKLRIQNFRSLRDVEVTFDNYSCFVGANGSGKSTVLAALNLFFRNSEVVGLDVNNLKKEDFYGEDTATPIKLVLEFDNLSEEAKEDFGGYVRQNKLVISCVAKWDEGKQVAPVTQHGIRTGIRDFATFFEEEKAGAKVEELKGVYSTLMKSHPDLPEAKQKQKMKDALWEFEESHTKECEEIESRDEFYGFSKGKNKLEKYIQWIYVPAVKDASSEQEEGRNTAIGQLLNRTIRAKVDFSDSLIALFDETRGKYDEIISAKAGILSELSESLQQRLREWAHPTAILNLQWYNNPDKSIQINEPTAKSVIGEDAFSGELCRMGHGLQRSYLVALLQELALNNPDEIQPSLILAIEEPELYQHPPQAKHLATVLEDLSKQQSQILLTTHSPYFISSRGFESIRLTRKNKEKSESSISFTTLDKVAATIANALGGKPQEPSSMMATIEQIMHPTQNEMYFSPVCVLVEGTEDVAFLSTHLIMSKRWESFRRYGCSFIITDGKTNMSRPLAIANCLNIPTFTIFDGDLKENRAQERENHKRNNQCLGRLSGNDIKEYPPTDIIWGDRMIMWTTDIRDELRREYGEEAWDKVVEEVRKSYGYPSKEVSKKNHLLTVAILETLEEKGWVSKKLEEACNRILNFASTRL